MPDPKADAPLVLLVSPSQWVTRSLDSILVPAGYTVLRTFTAEQAMEQAAVVRPDVVIIDDRLPDGDAPGLCERLRSSGALDPTSPVLVTSQALEGRETRLRSLRAGAWGHLTFPLDAEEMLLSLEVFLGAKRAADSLRDLSLIDPLTGCYSARGLLRRAHELGAEAMRHGRALACATIAPSQDGDTAALPDKETVRTLARLIDLETRDSDSVGRIGHSEFVVLAPDTGVEGVRRMAERLTEHESGKEQDPEQGARWSLRAGCFAVQNFRDAAIDATELLTRSTLALRQTQATTTAPRVHFFRAGAVH
jgi:PleD family two-component response regulator